MPNELVEGIEEVRIDTPVEISPEDQRAALDSRIEYSRQHAIPKVNLTDNGSLIYRSKNGEINGYGSPESGYEFDTKMEERMLPSEKVQKAGVWANNVLQGTAIQAPEYQAMIPEVRSHANRLYLSSDAFFGSRVSFERGGVNWELDAGDEGFTLSTKSGDVSESTHYFPHGRYSEPELAYERKEVLPDSVAILSERNTDEAITGVEDIMRRFREAGELRNVPKDLLKNSESIWESLLKIDPRALAGKAVGLVTSAGTLMHHPSIESAAAAGAIAAGVGIWTKLDLADIRGSLSTDAENIIEAGNIEWERSPR